MRLRTLIVVVLMLFPTALLSQSINWEAMDDIPYFVKNASSVSIGWDQNGEQHSYLIASDLLNRYVYSSYETGAEHWSEKQPIQGATKVSICRIANGLRGALMIPAGQGIQYPGVRFTTDGGQSWTYREDDGIYPNEQPINRNLSCIAVNPVAPNFCVVGAKTQGENYTPWQTSDGGVSWTANATPTVEHEEVNSIRFDSYTFPPPNSSWLQCFQNKGWWYYLLPSYSGVWR
jgi:hypothetical protein